MEVHIVTRPSEKFPAIEKGRGTTNIRNMPNYAMKCEFVRAILPTSAMAISDVPSGSIHQHIVSSHHSLRVLHRTVQRGVSVGQRISKAARSHPHQ